MKALLVDAYDSFVYVIYQYLCLAGVDTDVVRNDKVTPALYSSGYDFVVLGPGPGHPADSHYPDMIRSFSAANTPVLGICLGHQAIGLTFGGKVLQAAHLMHGKTSSITHDGKGCFAGQSNPFPATRYHSLIVERDTLPPVLEASAWTEDDGYLMAMRHRDLPIESVQFHPESILTESGLRLITNFVQTHVLPRSGRTSHPLQSRGS